MGVEYVQTIVNRDKGPNEWTKRGYGAEGLWGWRTDDAKLNHMHQLTDSMPDEGVVRNQTGGRGKAN
jgi:hypothetical protein